MFEYKWIQHLWVHSDTCINWKIRRWVSACNTVSSAWLMKNSLSGVWYREMSCLAQWTHWSSLSSSENTVRTDKCCLSWQDLSHWWSLWAWWWKFTFNLQIHIWLCLEEWRCSLNLYLQSYHAQIWLLCCCQSKSSIVCSRWHNLNKSFTTYRICSAS